MDRDTMATQNEVSNRSEYLKQYRVEHRDKHRQYMREWSKNNRDRTSIYNKNTGIKRIGFKGKRIILNEDPRLGICQICGAVKGMDCKRTHMHHISYHPEDPLRDTIEVCGACHKRQHKIWVEN